MKNNVAQKVKIDLITINVYLNLFRLIDVDVLDVPVTQVNEPRS